MAALPRSALLSDLFVTFADFSDKASQIFRELADTSTSKGLGKKTAGKAPREKAKQKKLSGYQIFANGKR
eukprot:SAG11_NODE_2423_length_3379_cov_7.970732_2_plen_70_part_00